MMWRLTGSAQKHCTFLLAIFFLAQQSPAASNAVPAGGNFVAGAGVIAASGNAVTINQSSLRGVINWANFSIGNGGVVRFNNGSGATLNRVTGGNISSILGSLISSGSVYVLNPQGVLIGNGAHIHTGGDFVASTLNVSNTGFMSGGSLLFQDAASAIVVNLGEIYSQNGSIFLIGHDVKNSGSLNAANGSIGLAAGGQILLKDSSTDQRMFVRAPAGDVTNTGTISAAEAELKTDGGNIYALAGNNGGQIKATGTATINGQVWLVADAGTANVSGSIYAQNQDGTGGAVETSGRNVAISGASVRTGRNGSWLLDPDDLTIDAPLAATITAALNGESNVTESTSAPTAGGQGDINVNASIGWQTSANLTLSAYRNINFNNGAVIHNDLGYTINNMPYYNTGSLILRTDNSGTGTGYINFLSGGGGHVDFSQSLGTVSLLYDPTDAGTGKYNHVLNYSSAVLTNNAYVPPADSQVAQRTVYMLVNNMQDLQAIETNKNGIYALGGNLDATSFVFTPIGSTLAPFTGVFEGFGNTISNLALESSALQVGLFAASSGVVRHVGLMNASLLADNASTVGGLVAVNTGTVDASFFNGYVSGYIAGGIVGDNSGRVIDTFAMGKVGGGINGGLVGMNEASGSIATSYSTSISNQGLVGSNSGGTIVNSYWDTDNSGTLTTSGAGTGVTRNTLQGMMLPSGFSTNVWALGNGDSYPYLQWQYPAGTPVNVIGTVYSDQSQTRTDAGYTVSGIVNGVRFGQTVYSGADGYYYLQLPPSMAPSSGGIVTYLTGGPVGNAFSDLNGPVFRLPITENSVALQSRTTSLTGIVTTLQTALGGLSGDPNLLFNIGSGHVLNINNYVDLDLMTDTGSLNIDQPLTVNNLIIEGFANTSQTSAISVNNLSLLGGGNFTLTDAGNSIQTLATAPSRNKPFVDESIVRAPFSFRAIDAIGHNIRPFTSSTQSILVNAQGDLHIGVTDAAEGLYSANSAIIQATGNLIIDNSIPNVQANGTGDSLILTDGGSFFNSSNLGAATLSTPNGAWLVWSQNPANDNRGGIAYNFKQYNAVFGLTAPAETDDGVLYTQAPILTASIGPITRQYNATNAASIPASSYGLLGSIDNDTVTLNKPTSGTFANKNVGVNKTITVNGLSETAVDGLARVYGYQLNPTLVMANAGTITPAPLVELTIASNKVYDGTRTDMGTTTLNGAFTGDNVSLVGTGTYTFANKNAGLGKAVATTGFTLAGVDAGNYTVSLNAPVANITPAPVTATYEADNKVYDGTSLAEGMFGSLSGIVSGDTIALTGTPAFNFSDKNAGSNKPVSITGVSLTGPDAGNYTLDFNASATITPAQVSATFAANSKVYNANTLTTGTLGNSLSGVLPGDSVSLSGTAAYNFSDKNVGIAKPVSASGVTLAGTDAGNYTLTLLQAGHADITPAQLLYFANDTARPFGSLNPALFGSIVGLAAGDTLASVASGTLNFTSPAVSSSQVGSYAINGSGLTLLNNNYVLAQAPGNSLALTVSPIVVTIGNAFRYSGSPNPTFTVNYAGSTDSYLRSILNSFQLVTNAPANDTPGVYQITAVVPAQFAADLTIQAGTLTIAPATSVSSVLFPAALANQYQIPPPPLVFPSSSNTLLLPGNATGIFHIDIQASPGMGNGFQGAQSLGDTLSTASFTDSSPDGRTTDHRSLYAAGAHQ